MHLSMLSPRGGGGGRARGGDFDIFHKKKSNSPPPGQNNWSKSRPRASEGGQMSFKPCCTQEECNN